MTIFRYRTGRLALAAVLAAALAGPALAQVASEVTFAPGTSGAIVEGTVTGDAYADYQLGADAGQTMAAELTVTESDGDGTVHFNILTPGSDGAALYVGSTDGNSAKVELPEDGVYTIRVYQMGNDKDTGKTSAFNLDLSIQ